MSSLLYGALTRKREEATSDTSKEDEAPGVGTYADALAALVPAEVLSVHAVVMSNIASPIPEAWRAPAQFIFWFLVVISAVLYLAGHRGLHDRWDIARMLLPPLAFVGWTMLQKATVLDAVAPQFGQEWRWVIGIALAIVLGLAAKLLGDNADEQPARTQPARAVRAVQVA
jgi:hypothetical protein